METNKQHLIIGKSKQSTSAKTTNKYYHILPKKKGKKKRGLINHLREEKKEYEKNLNLCPT